MRNIIVLAALAASVLPAVASRGQTVDICDRTQQVRNAILEAVDADDCAAVDSESLAGVVSLWLPSTQLTALRAGDFDGLTRLGELALHENELTTLPDGVFDGLDSMHTLHLTDNLLTSLPSGVFDSLTSLQWLLLNRNRLTDLPGGVFDGLANLRFLYLDDNRLTALPAGAFDDLASLGELGLSNNRFTALPSGVFDGLDSLYELGLSGIQWTTLPAGMFDGLANLSALYLSYGQLTSLPDGVFDGLAKLSQLDLQHNQLTTLPAGVFDGLTSLSWLHLYENQLSTLPAGVFDSLTNLTQLHLQDNSLTSLPDGVFDDLTNLRYLNLSNNHLVGLTYNDPLFDGLSRDVEILLGGQTEAEQTEQTDPPPRETPQPARRAVAVPLMLSASDSTRQGFVRVVNESEDFGSVRVLAFDDSGHAPGPIEFRLDARRVFHFNSDDLEYGNAAKGLGVGVGRPIQGDWRLDIESDLTVRVMAFVRHGDGFLTAMHDMLPRDAAGRLVAHTFNPGGNTNQASSLRLVNTGENDESVSIEGVDDQGGSGGPVTLWLPAGESRTVSAFDLENGAQGLAGTLGDGAGKWRLLITAGDPVVGMSLLESASGHLTNISTAGTVD